MNTGIDSTRRDRRPLPAGKLLARATGPRSGCAAVGKNKPWPYDLADHSPNLAFCQRRLARRLDAWSPGWRAHAAPQLR